MAMSLDWTEDLVSQISANDPREASVIIAVETVWLKELIKPFVTTFVNLLRSGQDKIGYFVFLDRYERKASPFQQFRSKETSTTFASTKELFGEFAAQGCEFSVLHVQEAPKTPGKSVNIYQIKLK